MFSVIAFGQEIPSEIGVALSILGPFMAGFVEKYPVLGDIFAVMLISRLVIKPLMSAMIAIAESTEVKFLDEIAEFADSKIYKIIAFVLDWVFSLKLPKKKK